MGNGVLIILDVVVIFCLSIAIPYMFSLMKNIKSIKAGKTDLQKLVVELTASINKADKALVDMKKAVEVRGREMQTMLDRSGSVIDEMTFINKASDNLAERLGRLVSEGGQIIDSGVTASGKGGGKKVVSTSSHKDKKMLKSDKDLRVKDKPESNNDDDSGIDDVFKRLEDTLSKHDNLDDVFSMDGDFGSGISRSEKDLERLMQGVKKDK